MYVTPEERNTIDRILRFYLPDQEIWAFGSRVNGQRVKKFSDLDLVVITKERMQMREWARVKDAFELSSLPYRVDVLDWSRVSPEFQKIIEQSYEVVQIGGNKAESIS